MVQHFEAIYERGVLRPLVPLDMPEQTQVVVDVMPADAPPATNAGELTDADFERILDELTADGPTVDSTFTRADIYFDHD